MAFVLVIIKAIVEVGGLALVAQFLIGIFAWGRRQQNPIYRLLGVIASPFTKLARWVSPRVILDQHVPAVAFLLLLIVWIVVLLQLQVECRANPAQRGCPIELQGR